MAEEKEEVLSNKDIEVKGINTVTDNVEKPVETDPIEIDPIEIETPKKESEKKETTPEVVDLPEIPISKIESRLENFPKALEYKIPETKEEAFMSSIGQKAATGGESNIEGFRGLVDADALKEVYTPLNLTEAIPDALERQRFRAFNEDKLVDLFDGKSAGITFEKDIADIYKFKQKQYHRLTKQFIDDLDENESWIKELGMSGARFVGNTLVATVGNLLGSVYAAGSALVNWDATKLYDNAAYEALDYIQGGLDVNLVTYGGSDVYNEVVNPDTGLLEFEQKNFFGRFWNDPLKSLNADVVPAASFVAGAVVSELLAGAATAASGGLGGGLAAATAARIGLRASKLFSKAGRMSKFSKATRMIRGLDKIPGAEAAELNRLTNAYRSSMGTVAAGYRSSAYESGLIGKDTQESTYNNLLVDHHTKMGGTITEDGRILDKDGNQLETYIEPTELEKAEYQRIADAAGTSAYLMNVPLVAGSHFIQMPGLFRKNYRIANTTARNKSAFRQSLDNLKLGGYRVVDGKRIANVDANKYLKALGYGKASIKGGITEGFEEFAQGGIQEGLVDYYANDYSEASNLDISKMIRAIGKQSAAFLNTTEGIDSISIGALMGMLGIRLPFKTDASGKMRFSATGTGFGGARQEIKQAKENIKKAKDTVEFLNKNGLNPMLASNFRNSLKHKATQAIKDEAASKGDVKGFKDAEHAQLFSGIYNRVNLGLGDSVIQDIEILENMSLDLFNEQFAAKDADGKIIEEFTEKSKEEALKKAKETAEGMLQSIAIVKELTNVQKPDLIQKAISKVTGKKIGPNLDVATIKEGMEEQMAYLNSTVQNTLKREKDLTEQIQDITGTSLNVDSLNKVVAQITGVNLNSKKLEFTNRAEEVKREILKDWKESDPVNYNMNLAKVEPLLNDILGLKIRRAEAAKMYQGLFTPKGAEQFANFQIQLDEARIEEITKIQRKETEEAIDKTRNAAQVANEKKNEASINNGNTPATNKKINEDTVKGLSEIKNILDDKNITGEEEVKQIMTALDKNPGLLFLVKEKLQEKNIPLIGVKTAQEISLIDVDGSITAALLETLEELQKLNIINKNGEVFLESYTGQNNQAEGTPGKLTLEELKGKMQFEGTANEYFTFINSYEYVIGKDGKVQLDDKGNPIMMNITKDKTFVKDYDIINDPDFLTNQYLKDTPTYFTFKIADNDYNKQSNRTDNDMAIDVLYTDPKTGKEVFISRLPAVYENSPQQLKELRKEIIKREKAGQDTTAEVSSNRIQEIKKEKEVIKKKLQENLDAKKEAPVAETAPSTFVHDKVEYYYAPAKDSGIFKKKQKTENKNKAFYKLFINKEGTQAEFEFFSSPRSVEQALGQQEEYIYGTAEKGEFLDINAKEIYTTKRGKAIKKDGDWVITEQAEVKTTKPTTEAPTQTTTPTKKKNLYYKVDNFLDKEPYMSKTETKDTNFRIEIDENNPNQGKLFLEIADAKTQKEFVSTMVNVLQEKAIEYTNLEVWEQNNDNVKGLITVEPGVVTKQKDRWTVTKKAKAEWVLDLPTQGRARYQEPTTETTQPIAEVTEEEFKEFTDNATVSDERINAIVNKIKAGTELTTQEQAMREEKAAQVEEALKEGTTTELDAEQAELKAKLNALNEELKGLAGSIQVDLVTNKTPKGIFGKVSSLEKIAERKREEKRKELEEDFGKKNIERAEAINKNFDDIVKAIETSGIQIFLNPETNKHKNC